ncbi:MAG: T9SS type A sorting domain-containing protein [Flavobacteriales bacterium]
MKRTLFCLILISLLCPGPAEGQALYYRYDSIAVISGNDTLFDNAWAGGFNSPQFSSIDLNGDSIKDLFVFDRSGNTIKTFINKGDSGKVSYRYAPEYIPLFPVMRDWVLLVDYNCDGYEDIFTHSVAGIAVYKNDFALNDTLAFSLVTPLLKSDYHPNYVNLYVSAVDIPAIADIDNDGDVDILTFGVIGTIVEYHQNLSMDSTGSCDTLMFNLADNCWGKFYENSLSNGVTYPINCRATPYNGHAVEETHSGSTILALDIDQDHDKELVLGDISYPNLTIVVNGGDSSYAQIVADDTLFPKNVNNTIPAMLQIFPASFYLDVNNDGVKDFIASPNAQNASMNKHSAWYFRNDSLTDLPDFHFVKDDFLQDEMIELGKGCNPVFFDANADGLLDIIAGNYGYFHISGNYPSGLAYFKNTGSQQFPEFKLDTIDYMGLMGENLNGVYPAIGDMDADGDEDMVVGDYTGVLYYFENTAGVGNPAVFVLTQANYMGIDVGYFAAPQIVDVDRDGDNDLLVGEAGGTVNYFENLGSPQMAFFTDTATNDFFGGVDAMPLCCEGYSSPFLTPFDSTGDYFLLLGTDRGVIQVYSDVEGNLNGTFTLLDSIVTNAYRIRINVADLNGDQRYEILVGEYGGGMHILTTDAINVPVVQNNLFQPLFEFNLYPNPANKEVFMQFSRNINMPVEITVWDLLSREVYHTTLFNARKNRTDRIPLSGLEKGVYFITAKAGDNAVLRKLIKL